GPSGCRVLHQGGSLLRARGRYAHGRQTGGNRSGYSRYGAVCPRTRIYLLRLGSYHGGVRWHSRDAAQLRDLDFVPWSVASLSRPLSVPVPERITSPIASPVRVE